MLHSICQYIWKTRQWPQDWKKSVFIPIPKKGNAKEWSNYHKIALISHVSKAMLKILQARLQQNVNLELLAVQAGFRKGRGIKDQIANICWIIKKPKRVPEKYLLLPYWLHRSLWLYAKSLQSCPTQCDPIHGSSPGSPVPGILQARTPLGLGKIINVCWLNYRILEGLLFWKAS